MERILASICCDDCEEYKNDRCELHCDPIANSECVGCKECIYKDNLFGCINAPDCGPYNNMGIKDTSKFYIFREIKRGV